MSKSTENAIITSVGRAVLSFCQQSTVAIKEGGNLLEEEEEELDEAHKAGFSADEASLYRLGGFALFALLKTKNVSKEIQSILSHLRLPLDEKVNLPSNIQHLDKGGMTFMRKELLGYMGMVCAIHWILNLLIWLYLSKLMFILLQVMLSESYFPCTFFILIMLVLPLGS